ncbi:MAG: hypothetical protein ACLSA6_00085 [Holdemania massiliensis]
MKETTGIDRKRLFVQAHDAKVNRNLNVSGLTLTQPSAAAEAEQETTDAQKSQAEDEPVAD